MAVNQDIRKKTPSVSVLFNNPAFDNSIIGTSFDGRAIYDYNKMVKEFMNDENCTEDDAIEWIEYNTLRTIGYIGEKPPIIVFSEEQEEKRTKKIIKKTTFEIEKYNGETFFAFEIAVFENGDIEISKTKGCSLADTDGDYIFDTDNELFRIQED